MFQQLGHAQMVVKTMTAMRNMDDV